VHDAPDLNVQIPSVRTLAAITAAVPVRLMKRDLLFVAERLTAMLNDNHLIALARQHGIKPAKEGDSIPKLFTAYLRRVEESKLGSVVVELTIILAAARGVSAKDSPAIRSPFRLLGVTAHLTERTT